MELLKKKRINNISYENKSLPQLELLAWSWFSKYIRLRDRDHNGWGYCITCNKAIMPNEGHAGHCLSRRYSAIKYDERNVNLQCVSCNTFHNGRQDVYRETVDAKWGEGTYQELVSKKGNLVKKSRLYFIALIEQYKLKVSEL